MDDVFWKAVDDNDVDTVAKLLDQSPSLVDERFVGEAWKPKHIWNHEPAGQILAPPDFPFTNSALHTAAVNARTELARLLLQRRADANSIGYEPNNGLTPAVVLAAWEGSLETLRVLLENGADPNLPASADTALYAAAEHGFAEKVDLLIAHGARHSIFTAAIVGDVECVQRMLAAYPPLRDARSAKRGRTPKQEAEHHQQSEVLKLF